MRKQLDASLESITTTSEAITSQVEARTKKLEDESSQVQAFLGKAERSLATKVASEQLTAVKSSFDQRLEECRSVLMAQMTVVRERVERSVDDFNQVTIKVPCRPCRRPLSPHRSALIALFLPALPRLTSPCTPPAPHHQVEKAARADDLLPLADAVSRLRTEQNDTSEHLASKADHESMNTRLEELALEQKAQHAALSTKADAGPHNERHEAFVAATRKKMNALREQSANLGNAITSVEQAVEMVSSVASTKAEEREVAEVARMGEDELSGNKICWNQLHAWLLEPLVP
jgi:hypothetical protein